MGGSANSDQAAEPSPYGKVRVNETRIRRVYDEAAINALIQDDLLKQSGRPYAILRDEDTLTTNRAASTSDIDAVLTIQEHSY